MSSVRSRSLTLGVSSETGDSISQTEAVHALHIFMNSSTGQYTFKNMSMRIQNIKKQNYKNTKIQKYKNSKYKNTKKYSKKEHKGIINTCSVHYVQGGTDRHQLLCWTNTVGAKADKFSEIFQQLLKLPHIFKAEC